MGKFLRRRLSYANVVATLALFVALGGSAAAAVIVTNNSEIAPNTIYGANLPAGKNDNIVNGSVGTSDLAASAVTNPKLATGAVGSDKLAAKAVIAGKLGDGAVALTNLANGAVGTSKLADGAVTLPKLGNDVITEIDSHTGTMSQFSGTVADNTSQTVKTVAGVNVTVNCQPDQVQLGLSRVATGTLRVSGTKSHDTTTVLPVHFGGGIAGFGELGNPVIFDVLVQNTDVGKFVHADVQTSTAVGTGCDYWGTTQVAS
jgi:hypothetical protein